MKSKPESQRRDRQDWGIVLLIFLLGFLCVTLAGGWALRLTPNWEMNAGVESKLNPNSDFNTKPGFLAPLDVGILTKPAWMDVFLTPGASFATGTPPPTGPVANNVPTELTTTVPVTLGPLPSTPIVSTNTLIPTNTIVWVPLPATRTPKPGGPPPPPPTTPAPPPGNADLQIALVDGVTTYDAGVFFTYQVTVTNLGPNAVTGAAVMSARPAQFSTWDWACTPAVASCTPMSGAAPFSDSVDLASGASITYTVTATIPAGVSGALNNTAQVLPPANPADPNLGNNTAGPDTNMPGIDLQIVKTGPANYTAGGAVSYTITVTNASTFTLNGVTVTDVISPQLTNVDWSSTCGTSGTGNINDGINIAPMTDCIYTVNATAQAAAVGTLPNSANAVAPAGFTERNPGNETSPTSAIGPNGGFDGQINIGPGDGNTTVQPSGNSTILLINPGVSGSFVFYERYSNSPLDTEIQLDMVQISVSTDGSSWQSVFYWGDGDPGNNGSIPGIYCPGTEDDNCVIQSTDLVGGTGISITLPPGTFPWIQITCPAGDSGDGCDIDSIQP